MLINAGAFIRATLAYRQVYISGTYAKHKTAFSYRLAREYLQKGYRLLSNNKSVWADHPDDVQLLENGHLKAVVIVDEAGIELESTRQIKAMRAYSAKMDMIFLYPTAEEPPAAVRALEVQPVFDFIPTGIPLIVYKWRLTKRQHRDAGSFFWLYPREIYGIYSRQDPGDRVAALVNLLSQRVDEFRRYHGRGQDELSALGSLTEADLLTDAAGEMAAAAESLTSILEREYQPRKRGKRR